MPVVIGRGQEHQPANIRIDLHKGLQGDRNHLVLSQFDPELGKGNRDPTLAEAKQAVSNLFARLVSGKIL